MPNKNLSFATEQLLEKWANDHYNRAMKLISTASSIEDFQRLLRDRANAESKTAICSTLEEDECFTYSAFIFDTRNCRAYYCQGNPLENDFKEYDFGN